MNDLPVLGQLHARVSDIWPKTPVFRPHITDRIENTWFQKYLFSTQKGIWVYNSIKIK